MIITMDNDHCYNSDEEVIEANHNHLLQSISTLDKSQHIKKPTRTEPALQVSEFNLVRSKSKKRQAVHLKDLANTLKKTAKHVITNKQVQNTQKNYRTLQKPLEKPVAECIKRKIGFRDVRNNLKRWDPIVTSNRVAEHLTFPLRKHPPLKLNNTSVELISRFRIKSDLQKELEALDPKPEENVEETKEFPLSLEEIIQRRKEVAKLRAQQSYQESKARRQNKIKSKKFHRIQRKEKLKQQIKEFEQLQKTDPEAALKKLNEIDKVRAEERVTLRHRSTGQWAKNKQIRAKYDKESRQILAQQLALSRELTQKINAEDSSESDNEKIEQIKSSDSNNPWLNPSNEVQEFISGYRKFWNEKNKNDSLKKQYDLLDVDENNKNENSKIGTDNRNDKEVITINSIEENTEIGNGKKDIKMKNEKKETTIKLNKNNTESKKGKKDNNLLSDEDQASDYVEDENDLKTFKLEINGLYKKESEKINGIKQGKITSNSDEDKSFKNIENREKKISISKMKTEKIKKRNMQIDESKNIINTHKKKTKICNLSDLKDKINENGFVDRTVSTSSWVVQEIKDTDVNTVSIDNIFENLECRINKKLESKLKNFNLQLPKTTKKKKIQNKDKKKQRHKNILNGNTQIDFKLRNKKIRPILDGPLDEVVNNLEENVSDSNVIPGIQNTLSAVDSVQKSEDIDPNDFMKVEPQLLNTALPELMTTGEDAIDDLETEESQKMTISEAFEDDDIVAEFQKEKQDDIDKNNPKDVDLTLPGWGSWGGTNIKVSKRKKSRFIIKFPQKLRRKDENRGNVIINESKETKPKAHQVNELPFPFKSVGDFETTLRAPIGNTFVTEKAYKRLIKPQVITKMGTVIEPINEDVLVNFKNKNRTLNK